MTPQLQETFQFPIPACLWLSEQRFTIGIIVNFPNNTQVISLQELPSSTKFPGLHQDLSSQPPHGQWKKNPPLQCSSPLFNLIPSLLRNFFLIKYDFYHHKVSNKSFLYQCDFSHLKVGNKSFLYLFDFVHTKFGKKYLENNKKK